MFKEILFFALLVILIMWTLLSAVVISSPAKIWDNPSLKISINNSTTYLKELFICRNLFGIILSSIVVLASIPGFILAILFSTLFDFYNLLVFIWNLGNKKSD